MRIPNRLTSEVVFLLTGAIPCDFEEEIDVAAVESTVTMEECPESVVDSFKSNGYVYDYQPQEAGSEIVRLVTSTRIRRMRMKSVDGPVGIVNSAVADTENMAQPGGVLFQYDLTKVLSKRPYSRNAMVKYR